MEKKVRSYMHKYHMTKPGDTVITGVSGGADSVCLLLMLADMREELGIELEAVHVHHGLREEADAEGTYVEALCNKLQVPFTLVKEDVAKLARKEKISCEEAGRQVRYRAFAQRAKVCGKEPENVKIAVAHHKNDRAETVLFHLFRGTGLTGLTGIRPVRDRVIRPLLCMSREEIEAYLRQQDICWCIDNSNAEDRYTRNKIRLHMLPYAEREICRGSTEHIVRAAETIEETEDFLQKYCEKAMQRCLIREKAQKAGKAQSLCIKELLLEHPVIQKRILLQLLRQTDAAGRDIGALHLESIQELMKTQGSKQLSLPHGIVVKKEYDILHLYRAGGEDGGRTIAGGREEIEEKTVRIPGELYLEDGRILHFQCFPYEKSRIIPQKSCTKWFDYDKIEKSMVVRTRRIGDYLTVDSSLSRQTLKKYMIQEKIPKEYRQQQYVLADGAHIMWVIGYRISQYYKVDETTTNILQVQLEERNEGHV